jgi:hypothetical protein
VKGAISEKLAADMPPPCAAAGTVSAFDRGDRRDPHAALPVYLPVLCSLSVLLDAPERGEKPGKREVPRRPERLDLEDGVMRWRKRKRRKRGPRTM